MFYYCTLFDSYYLIKGLALYESLKQCCQYFHLYVLAFDQDCVQKLQSIRFQNLTIITLKDFETPELLEVKQTRNKAEYCWTCGPSLIRYCIDHFNLPNCTYLDADMMFYSNPEIIYHEIGDNSVALTEHFNEAGGLEGKFCVQFVYFKNDENGLKALDWWKNKCIEWCYARFEEGKYGDQKYLDDIPELFENVCILKNRGAGVAPWNINQYDCSKYGKIKYHSEIFDVCFFHYHGTRVDRNENTLIIKTITYDLNIDVKENFYLSYLKLLKYVCNSYMNASIQFLFVEDRKWYQQFYSQLKKKMRNNKIAQFFYYKVLRVRYNGYEKQTDL